MMFPQVSKAGTVSNVRQGTGQYATEEHNSGELTERIQERIEPFWDDVPRVF